MTQFNADNIYFLGDTHSLDFKSIICNAMLEDFILIHVGDAGVGFATEYADKAHISALHSYCEEHNGRIFVIRGNHDDPKFFVEGSPYNTEKITFLPDYTYLNINDKVVLFVGGAISVDRRIRKPNVDYWLNEPFVLKEDYDTLSQCDVLVTHSSPIDCFPHEGFARIKGWLADDPMLKGELIKERQDIQKLYNHVNCNRLIYGHFHYPSSEYVEGCWHRCLDINEFYDATYDFK